MCGIIAYVGEEKATPYLLDGLSRLEYRGYDSSGIAVQTDDGLIDIEKCAGRLENLRRQIGDNYHPGRCGISHTRWATHGEATDDNAHPHFDQSGKLALVHNGVIENYQKIRDDLESKGHQFHSQTDSEVLAHLIGVAYDRLDEIDGSEQTLNQTSDQKNSEEKLAAALREALKQITGTYGIAVMHADAPDFLLGARLGSPLIVGLGKAENFLASDVSAVVAHTSDAIYLNDYDLVCLKKDEFQVERIDGGVADFQVSQVEFSAEDVELGDYPHYMLKEIFEQPESVENAFRGRLSDDEASAKLGGLQMSPQELRDVDRIVLVGCGTACHAAMAGEHLIEALARIPTEVEIASEFRYRNVPMDKNTLVFVLSQSGETIDSLGALREAKRKGFRVLGIVNSVGSTIARESDGGAYMHCGPEIGVAATKSFTSQYMLLTLLALLLGRMRDMSLSDGQEILKEIRALPDKIRAVLAQNDRIREIGLRHSIVSGT